MSSSSDLLLSSPNNYQTIGGRSMPERSCSPLTANELARRLRSAFTPPRSRRQKQHLEGEARPRSATASPGLTTSSELIGGMPPRQKTLSCGDIGRLENIFEPRLAPYTPPLKLRRGLDANDHSVALKGLSDEQIEKLETKLFEPRDAACTPPLRRRVLERSLTSEDEEDESSSEGSRRPSAEIRKLSSQSSVDGSLAGEEANNVIVTDLQRIVVQLRAKAKASSQDAVKQLGVSQPTSNEEVTVRQLARLQHNASVSSRQPTEVICC